MTTYAKAVFTNYDLRANLLTPLARVCLFFPRRAIISQVLPLGLGGRAAWFRFSTIPPWQCLLPFSFFCCFPSLPNSDAQQTHCDGLVKTTAHGWARASKIEHMRMCPSSYTAVGPATAFVKASWRCRGQACPESIPPVPRRHSVTHARDELGM